MEEGSGQTSAAVSVSGEVLKRRKRSAAERARIVEETLVAGASVAGVARVHGINANQIFAWRKLYLAGKLVDLRTKTVVPTASARLLPVTVQADKAEVIVSDLASTQRTSERVAASVGTIHIQFPKAQVRVEGAVDAFVLRAVLESLRS